MRRILILLVSTFIALAHTTVCAQDGVLDLTFNAPVHLNNPIYNGFQGISGSKAEVYAIKVLSNGKVLVYGDFTVYQGIPVKYLVLLNADGSLDTGFNVGSGPNSVPFYQYSNMLAEQPDGKIVVVGSFSTFNGVSRKGIVRLNPNGSVDTGFNAGTAAGVFAVALQNDGKILCGGEFTTFNGLDKRGLVRLNNDGSIDTTFNTGTGLMRYFNDGLEAAPLIYTITLQDDNKILVGGKFNAYNNNAKINLVRLNTNGSIDTSFNIGIGAGATADLLETGYPTIYQILYDAPTDKIYLAGTIRTFNGTPVNNIVKLNLDGSINTGFNFTAAVGNNPLFSSDNGYIYDIGLLNDGSMLVAGDFELDMMMAQRKKGLIKVNTNGSLDTNFVFYTDSELYCIDVATDAIMLGGYFSIINYDNNHKGSIVKIQPDGFTDISFNPNLGGAPLYGICASPIQLHDGSIIASINNTESTQGAIQQDFGIYNERPFKGMFKIEQNGAVYAADYSNFLATAKYSNFISYDLNNSLIVDDAGTSSKIFENGLPDTSFTPTAAIIAPDAININVQTKTHTVQSDGKIVIGGNFRYNYLGNNAYRQRIMRVNTNGSLDTTFNVGKGINGTEVAGNELIYINAFALQPDHKIVAGGQFTKYHDTPVNNIVRINPDGAIDNTFNIGIGFNNEVRKVVWLANENKFLVCGKFTSYNTAPAVYMAKLNPDGTRDLSFTSPYLVGSQYSRISDIIVQSDGKYIVSGYINGVQILNRLNATGTLDSTFFNTNAFTANSNFDSATYDLIRDMILVEGNKLLVTGNFMKVNTFNRQGIARFNNDSELATADFDAAEKMVIYPNPAHDFVSIRTTETIHRIAIYTIEGRFIKSVPATANRFDVSDLPTGLYLVKISTATGSFSTKLLKG